MVEISRKFEVIITGLRVGHAQSHRSVTVYLNGQERTPNIHSPWCPSYQKLSNPYLPYTSQSPILSNSSLPSNFKPKFEKLLKYV